MRFKLFATGECRHPVFLGQYQTLEWAALDVAAVDSGDGPLASTWPEGHDATIVDIETGDQFYVDEFGTVVKAEGLDLDPDIVAIFAK